MEAVKEKDGERRPDGAWNIEYSITRYIEDEEYTAPAITLPSLFGILRFTPRIEKALNETNATPTTEKIRFVVPVYIGVGLRLTAEIRVLNGQVNLFNLPRLASSVEAGNASGSLVVQTLGVTGQHVSTGLVFSSDLNETTVQNAILSLGKIKSILYSEETAIRPRVTGMYLPIQDGREPVVNAIVSELARKEIEWRPACQEITT